MPKIMVNDEEYKELQRKHSNDLHFTAELVPNKALAGMSNQGFHRPKSLLCYLFSHSTIARNGIHARFKWGKIKAYMNRNDNDRETMATLQQSFNPLITAGIVKIKPELAEKLKDVSL